LKVSLIYSSNCSHVMGSSHLISCALLMLFSCACAQENGHVIRMRYRDSSRSASNRPHIARPEPSGSKFGPSAPSGPKYSPYIARQEPSTSASQPVTFLAPPKTSAGVKQRARGHKQTDRKSRCESLVPCSVLVYLR
jgi:hypothetical protein